MISILAACAILTRPTIEIPMTVSGGRIYVPVEIQGKTTSFLLDTGAGANLVDLSYASKLKLNLGSVSQTTGVGSGSSRFATLSDCSCRISGLDEDLNMSLAVDLEPLSHYNDRPILGVIGLPFFRNRVVRIDFDAMKVEILSSAGRTPEKGAFIAKNVLQGQRMIVPASITDMNGSKKDARVQFDTGALGTLIFSSPTRKKFGFDALRPQYSLSALANGVGGTSPGFVCRPKTIWVGPYRFEAPTIRVSTATQGMLASDQDRDALLGYELFRRFRITIDLVKDELELSPSSAFRDEFPVDCSGIVLRSSGADYFIDEVVKNSPAAKAKLQVGDKILRLGGASVSGVPYSKLVAKLGERKGTLKILVVRGGQVLNRTLLLKPLV